MNTTTVVKQLNKRLETRWLEHEREPREVFSCSSAGQCHRKQILTRARVQITPMDVDQKRMLMQRTVLHDEVVKDLALVYRANGYQVLVEDELTVTDNLSGRTDIFAMDTTDIVVVDVKTVHPNITNYTDSLPKLHNVRQVQSYLYSCRGGSQRRKGLLVYVPMGQGQILPFEVEPDDEWVADEYEVLGTEWYIWASWLKAEYLPNPLPLVEKTRTRKGEKVVMLEQSWECSYCPHANTNWCVPNYPKNKTGDRKPEEVLA